MAAGGKILVGYTSDANGADAIALASLLARATSSGLVVLSVIYARSREKVTDDVEAAVREEVLGLVAANGAGAHDSPDVEVRTVASRSPARHLYETAEEIGASLIVVGPPEPPSRPRWRPGTVLGSLLQGAPCAVAVAPAGYANTPAATLASVAVAFNRSEEAEVSVDTGVSLASSCDAKLTLVSVVEPVPPGYGAVVAALTASEWESTERREKREGLDKAVAELHQQQPGIAVEGRLLAGLPGQVLAEASADFDLIIVGSREYGPFRRTLVGSTSRHLVAHAACPVMVTPRA